ncbi:MAG: dTMP kinase [Pigmentiphaga sp.]|nr:dTMP kinase [Pigmentiphaga sp.]
MTPSSQAAPRPGRFITVEGVDGAGKSTHLQWLLGFLQARQIPVLSTREPGGTELGETLRELLLHHDMALDTEVLLMFASRSEHLRTRILPALEAGQWVVCDRFTDASYAYQGGGRQLGADKIRQLEQWVHPDVQPDLTVFFDVPLDVARERLERSREQDRFEQEGALFFERTRDAYYQRIKADPQRFLVINSGQAIELAREQLMNEFSRWFNRVHPA